MGMNVGGNSRGVKAEINITPLVDVVLVLLIIFMVLVPIMMRQVVLDVPRKLNDNEVVTPDQAKVLSVLVKNDLSIVFNDGDKDTTVSSVDLAASLRPLLDAKKTEKVVFVDFEDQVPWKEVIVVMDTVRGLAVALTQKGTKDWDEIKVALKLRENPPAPL
jgi:biopolymer transport protein ExbD